MINLILKPILDLVFNTAQQKLGEVIPAYIEQVVGKEIDDPEKAKSIAEAIVADKTLNNQLSLEKPHESGVTVGSTGALIAAIAAEIGLFATGNLDPALHTPNILVIIGTLYALWKRWTV